jgi:hypothetical protein
MTSAYPAGENQPSVVPLRPHRGGAVLALGILSLAFLVTYLTCCMSPSPIFGIIAWIMGSNDLREMDQGIMDPAGRNNTNAGWICGIIATVINGLMILAGIAMLFLMLIMGIMGAIQSR